MTAALELARRFFVFPLDHPSHEWCQGVGKHHKPHRDGDRGKHPACKWSEWSTQDPATVAQYFTGAVLNIGIDCGKSGIVVIDEDAADEFDKLCADLGVDVPRTFTVRTGKGRHFYFRQPPGKPYTNKEGALRGYAVNVRGAGGYVVAPGSLHATGVIYETIVDTDPIDLPSWLAAALDGKAKTGDPSTNGDSDRGWWRTGTIPDGKKHSALVAAAGWCRTMGLTRDEAVPLVRDVHARCESDVAWEDALARLDDVFERYEAGDRAAERLAENEALSFDPPERNGSQPTPAPVTPGTLAECVATFQRWLYLPDPGIVIATVAATAANLLSGDPCWLLIVGPPSSAKTECVSALVPLPYVHPAAKVTETALLSGTPPKERVKGSRGGLMRQVGNFGILLLKDFTSVLAQNRDTRAEALAALREIYDGRWDRPVGTGGGITLSWSGKCGLVGGCTPTIDRHHAVMGTLGERFLFYRVNVEDPDDQATRRLTSRSHETDMRRELAAAVASVLAHAFGDEVGDSKLLTPPALPDPDPDEDRWLVSLAVFTARARTPVERNGYSHEVVVMPESEGPARIVTQLGAMRDGLVAIGATDEQRWAILHKLAWDAMPAMRRQVFRALEDADGWMKKAELMDATDIPEAPLRRELEDLVLIGLVDRSKDGEHDNSPWQHRLSAQAHALWPKARPRSTPPHGYDDSTPLFKEKSAGGGTNRTGTEAAVPDEPLSPPTDISGDGPPRTFSWECDCGRLLLTATDQTTGICVFCRDGDTR